MQNKMNFKTSHVLIAFFAIIGLITITPAFALELACPDCVGDSIPHAFQSLLDDMPVAVWTDSSIYDHGSTILVNGHVSNIRPATPVTLTVVSPLNNIVSVDQLTIGNDGFFSTTLSTAGNLWKYDGTYTIRVQYGAEPVNDKVLIQLTGGIVIKKPVTPSVTCNSDELAIGAGCIPYTISGATVISASTNTDDNSVIILLDSIEPGTLTVSPSSDVIRGIFMVLVDGEEWDDVEIAGNDVTVMFPAGTSEIEIIGTFVIPEFGTIAGLILAVSIISIIAVTAKTKLNVIPKL